MPTARSLIAGLALALTATACSDKTTTAPSNVGESPTTQPEQRKARQPLIFPANQVVNNAAGAAVATITKVQVTQFGLNSANKLTATGVATYTITATGQTVTQAFTNVEVQSFTSTGAPTAATCQILNLDIGAIHLDLLGLVVDLAPVHLDITAQSGPGNLLGNLLCAVTHLLDQNPLNISALTALLAQINALLSQILG
jgi:hypothetical protein